MYLRSSPDLTRVAKQGRIRWAGHMTRTGEKCLYIFGGGNGRETGSGQRYENGSLKNTGRRGPV